ncbi:MAG: hypothetical protein KDC75_15315 [Phaeodactylibacter sp.]|nr:hypothetical protein [Phaeodactylibacter sp.]MCB9304944.1 hypothetical protein [Lewinellaceae bacterium]
MPTIGTNGGYTICSLENSQWSFYHEDHGLVEKAITQAGPINITFENDDDENVDKGLVVCQMLIFWFNVSKFCGCLRRRFPRIAALRKGFSNEEQPQKVPQSTRIFSFDKPLAIPPFWGKESLNLFHQGLHTGDCLPRAGLK